MTDRAYRFLNGPKRIKALIKIREAEKEELRRMIEPGAIRYDKTKVKSSNTKDMMIEYLEKVEKLDREIDRLKDRYVKEINSVIQLIEKLPETREQEVLIARYIYRKKFEEIIDTLPESQATVYRLHKSGIKHLEEILNDVFDKVDSK